MEINLCIKIQVCNLEGTCNTDNGVKCVSLEIVWPKYIPSLPRGFVQSSTEPSATFLWLFNLLSGVTKWLFVIQPYALFAVKTYWGCLVRFHGFVCFLTIYLSSVWSEVFLTGVCRYHGWVFYKLRSLYYRTLGRLLIRDNCCAKFPCVN